MNEDVIRAYFETKLNTWAAAQSPVVPIAFEAVGFTKPDDAPYLEVFLMPTTTSNRSVGAIKTRERGIFQISVVAPTGEGPKEAQDLAKAIAGLFPVYPKDNAVSVEFPPHVSSAFLNADGRRTVPISITYRYDN